MVCFKLADNSDEKKRKRKRFCCRWTATSLLFAGSKSAPTFAPARSYDVILIVTSDDAAALDEYQRDEYHCSVVKKYMHAHVSSSVAVDYEI
ncbi:MAG: Dabb family protein [Christensenellales bacterium]